MSDPARKRFPVARFLLRVLRNWRERHQDRRNFAIHLVGIPMAVGGLVLLLLIPWDVAPWYWGVGGLIVGYLLQWIGHQWEGNDVGELIPIKRLLGLPTMAISPKFAKPRAASASQSVKTA